MTTNNTQPDASHVRVDAQGRVTALVGADAVAVFRAAQVKVGISLYARTGMLLTRGASISRLLDIAGEYTGKKYKPRRKDDLIAAQVDLDLWISTMQCALPVVQE